MATNKHVVAVGSVDGIETLFQDLLGTPGMLTDRDATPPPKEPWPFNQGVLDDSEYGVIKGETMTPRQLIIEPAHTVHVNEDYTRVPGSGLAADGPSGPGARPGLTEIARRRTQWGWSTRLP